MEQELPIELQELLDEWRIKKEAYRDRWDYGWPAKLVKTQFCYQGRQYCITPDMIGLERGDSWDEGFMEFLQHYIGEDLKALGAADIFHLGFMD